MQINIKPNTRFLEWVAHTRRQLLPTVACRHQPPLPVYAAQELLPFATFMLFVRRQVGRGRASRVWEPTRSFVVVYDMITPVTHWIRGGGGSTHTAPFYCNYTLVLKTGRRMKLSEMRKDLPTHSLWGRRTHAISYGGNALMHMHTHTRTFLRHMIQRFWARENG